jgi:hypothetical protein
LDFKEPERNTKIRPATVNIIDILKVKNTGISILPTPAVTPTIPSIKDIKSIPLTFVS